MALIDILKVNVPTEFGCEFEDDDMNDSMWELIRSIDRIKEFDYTDYAYGASQFCIMPAGREDIVINRLRKKYEVKTCQEKEMKK